MPLRHASGGSTGPHPDHTVLATFDEIPVLDPHPFDGRRVGALGFSRDAGTAIPVMPVRLVVDLHHILPGCACDSPRVKHHARDGLVVGKSIVDGSSTEVPYLEESEKAVSESTIR